MKNNILAIKLWDAENKGEKILARFVDHKAASVKDSYVGISFKRNGEHCTIYFSYNSLYQMYKAVLLNRIAKKM